MVPPPFLQPSERDLPNAARVSLAKSRNVAADFAPAQVANRTERYQSKHKEDFHQRRQKSQETSEGGFRAGLLSIAPWRAPFPCGSIVGT
mmetsp:Transcript_35650/g.73245  ORF Transcript_35650/g.73245 Transcript_35650/m.73245 type:complete len:90 (-) Transcript_35650:1037-1306(-)